ncbi:kinase-like domain-containing protein [Linnemannia elongata]|nr:kinase-like domain-containing protein [Linnemannia elongata]
MPLCTRPAMGRQIYKNEVNILKSLDHPIVVKYIDNLQVGDMTVIFMKQYQGGSLESLLKDAWKNHHNRKLSKKHVAPFMAGVVQALHHLHTIGLVHHGIKLGNILIDDKGNAKVADFGMSCYEQNGRKFGSKVEMAYHALELAGKIAFSPAVDVYAFGVIVYELPRRVDTVATEGISESATKVIITALNPSPVIKVSFRELLRYNFFEKSIPKEKRGLEGSGHASDTPSKRVAHGTIQVLEGTGVQDFKDVEDVEDAEAEKGDKGKEAQKNPVNAEVGEVTAKNNNDPAKDNVAENKINNKDKCLCTAHSPSDTQ